VLVQPLKTPLNQIIEDPAERVVFAFLHAEVPPESFPLGAGPLPRPDFFGRRQRKSDPICKLTRMTLAVRRICWSASGRVEQEESWLITAVALAKNRCSIKQLNVDRV
jgi:hypothetical protein